MDESRPVEAGEPFHFLVTGFSFTESSRYAGMVSQRGQQLTATADMIEANRDRNGVTWLDLLHDPDGQVARFGQVIAAPGPFPPDQLKTIPGSLEHDDARRAARQEASAIKDPTERKAALRAIEDEYGSERPTNTTLAHYS